MAKLICSFCRKSEDEVLKIIANEKTGANICDECVIKALDALGSASTTPKFTAFMKRRFQKMAFELRKILYPIKKT